MIGLGMISVLLLKLVVAGGTTTGLVKGSHWFGKKSFSNKKAGVPHDDSEHETVERRIR